MDADVVFTAITLDCVRQSIPDELSFFRDYDARCTISIPGVGEHVSVDFWAPIMAAHLEASGRISECKTEKATLLTLVDCLLETDFADFTNCPQLGDRARQIAEVVAIMRAAMDDVVERN